MEETIDTLTKMIEYTQSSINCHIMLNDMEEAYKMQQHLNELKVALEKAYRGNRFALWEVL